MYAQGKGTLFLYVPKHVAGYMFNLLKRLSKRKFTINYFLLIKILLSERYRKIQLIRIAQNIHIAIAGRQIFL